MLSFGMQVRYARLQIGMSAEEFGILYAKALGRKPYTRRRIEQMEHNDDFPTDPTRRWVIEKIVKMGLFFPATSLGVDLITAPTPFRSVQTKKLTFEISEHSILLKKYWTEGFPKTPEEAEEEILTHISALHDTAPYVSHQQKMLAWRILAGYHILLATDIYAAKNDLAGVTRHTNLALIVARENSFFDLYALALLQHGVFLRTQGNFSTALRDLQVAQRPQSLPLQLRGKILAETARVKASIAQKQEEVDEALCLLDQAEGMIEGGPIDDFDYFVAFDADKYQLDRGEVLTASPLKQLRSPETALSYLPKIYRVGEVTEHGQFQTIGHRQAHNHIVQAAIHIDQEMYPIAITLIQEALDFVERVQSKVHLKKLLSLYEVLKRSPYGSSTEVTMLEIGLMRL